MIVRYKIGIEYYSFSKVQRFENYGGNSILFLFLIHVYIIDCYIIILLIRITNLLKKKKRFMLLMMYN